MPSQAPKRDLRRLRKLYGSDPAARIILDHLASRHPGRRTTNVDQLLASLRASEEDVSRGEAIGVFKELEECGCGHFKAGRKGWPSRFEWAFQMASVGQAAAGESDQIDEITEEDLAEDEGQVTLRHTYRLRADISINFDLPQDLTPGEAERLAQFIRTLPFGPAPSLPAYEGPPEGKSAADGDTRKPSSAEPPSIRSDRRQRIGYAASSRVPPGRRR